MISEDERTALNRVNRALSLLLQSIWLFFPAILFIGLTLWCFWNLDQGKDLVVAFMENPKSHVYFFIAIGFWSYVTWYSSRVIAYLKTGRTGDRSALRMSFPGILANGCFLAIEITALQSSLAKHPLKGSLSGWIFLTGLLVSSLLDLFVGKYVAGSDRKEKTVRRLLYLLLVLFILFMILISSGSVFPNDIRGLFWLVLCLQILFILYSNLRPRVTDREQAELRDSHPVSALPRTAYAVMRFFRIPQTELGHFIFFNILCLVALVIYLLEINSMDLSVHIGPFPSVILAFAILLGFANILSALSVRSGINLHFIILLLAFLIHSPESHYIRTRDLSAISDKGVFLQKASVAQYFDRWLADRGSRLDSTRPAEYPIYFVLSNGGASRSAYWTASVLGRLEDSSLAGGDPFSRHVFCLSGTSGGGVGVAAFYALLHQTQGLPARQPCYERSARAFLGRDFLSYTLVRMLGPDYFRYILHLGPSTDRAAALEESLEEQPARHADSACYPLRFSMTMDSAAIRPGQPAELPVLCINTTRMQDGNPGVITNISLRDSAFNNRIDVLTLLDSGKTMRLSTAAIMGARFPYISPAGRLDERIPKNIASYRKRLRDSCCQAHYFVDGGYFDNSGAGVVQEMIGIIMDHLVNTSDTTLRARARKLRLVVLHITNSPMGDPIIGTSRPITNDLMSPLLTLFGAYDMQTTVNDNRLEFYVEKELKRRTEIGSAHYSVISLYPDPWDPRDRHLPAQDFTMNWFISDAQRDSMDKRLRAQPALHDMIAGIKQWSFIHLIN